MKVLLLLVLIFVSTSNIISQSWSDYLNPFDSTITTAEDLTIYGRLRMSDMPDRYGTDTNFIAKILINIEGQDARFSQLFSFDAIYDKHIDSAKQFKGTISNIPAGTYWYCYGYYLNNELKVVGGGAFNDNFMHFGTLTVTSVTNIDENNLSPMYYSLNQNFPNPFNPTTKINYSIPQSGFVTLKVYNIIGMEVATLVNEERSIGIHEVDFDGTNLSSGTYFYKIHAGSFTDTKKFILLK